MRRWQILSGLLLERPRVFVSTAYLRRALRAGREEALVYAVDRMWPAVAHGQVVRVRGLDEGPPTAGDLIVVDEAGSPDLLRVCAVSAGGIRARADADPAATRMLAPGSILGVAAPRGLGVGLADGILDGAIRRLRRSWLDLGEAVTSLPAGSGEPAASARHKYERQAGAYKRSPAVGLTDRLLDRLAAAIRPGGRVLVAGCGTGRECFTLAAAGYRPTGVDFSTAMIAAARDGARERGLQLDFLQPDLLRLRLDPGSLDGVLFTFDVYSFLPGRRARVDLLRRMAGWLRSGGGIFLSARMVNGAGNTVLSGVEWLARRLRGGGGEWGDSHTRWLGPDGEVQRAFIHRFSPRGVHSEVQAAGLSMAEWEAGHALLTPRRPTPPGSGARSGTSG